MPQSKLLVHPADGVGHRITPASAGWRYVEFETRTLKEGAQSKLDTGGGEVCIVILSGKARVTANGFDTGTIGERAIVFDGLPWSVYIPAQSQATIEAKTVANSPSAPRRPTGVSPPASSARRRRHGGPRRGLERAPCAQRPAGGREGRERAGRRSDDARRQLVELSAAQARHATRCPRRPISRRPITTA